MAKPALLLNWLATEWRAEDRAMNSQPLPITETLGRILVLDLILMVATCVGAWPMTIASRAMSPTLTNDVPAGPIPAGTEPD